MTMRSLGLLVRINLEKLVQSNLTSMDSVETLREVSGGEISKLKGVVCQVGCGAEHLPALQIRGGEDVICAVQTAGEVEPERSCPKIGVNSAEGIQRGSGRQWPAGRGTGNRLAGEAGAIRDLLGRFTSSGLIRP